MTGWTISEVARRVGLKPSAIRYYEAEGLLPKPTRQNGRRVYDPFILQWLALIRVAREAGFSISDIRTLLNGFSQATPASVRWRILATGKLQELREQTESLKAMEQILERLLDCECPTLHDCGSLLTSSSDT